MSGVVSKVGDWAFKGFTAGLGLATIYLAGTFSINMYRGFTWHNSNSQSESKPENEESKDQSQ
ncbi:hypothetical protein Scep_017661 [Stephania cephalantha]|uniref:Uncharacterized protein n=1 Tax=Stephania cephalantha TaxID=152367 RepID=A0AAP0IRA4_9MAGN